MLTLDNKDYYYYYYYCKIESILFSGIARVNFSKGEKIPCGPLRVSIEEFSDDVAGLQKYRLLTFNQDDCWDI